MRERLAYISLLIVLATPHSLYLYGLDAEIFVSYSYIYVLCPILGFTLGLLLRPAKDEHCSNTFAFYGHLICSIVLAALAMFGIFELQGFLQSLIYFYIPLQLGLLFVAALLTPFLGFPNKCVDRPSGERGVGGPDSEAMHRGFLFCLRNIVVSMLFSSGWGISFAAGWLLMPQQAGIIYPTILVLAQVVVSCAVIYGLKGSFQNAKLNDARKASLLCLIGSVLSWVLLVSSGYFALLPWWLGIVQFALAPFPLCVPAVIHMKKKRSVSNIETSAGQDQVQFCRIAEHLTTMYSNAGLAESEIACVAYMLEGKTSSEVAKALSIKPSTVRSYLTRAYRKLGVHNLRELKEKEQGFLQSNQSDIKENAVKKTCQTQTLFDGNMSVLISISMLLLLFVGPVSSFAMNGWYVTNGIAIGALLSGGSFFLKISSSRQAMTFHSFRLRILRDCFGCVSICFLFGYFAFVSYKPEYAWSCPLLCFFATIGSINMLMSTILELRNRSQQGRLKINFSFALPVCAVLVVLAQTFSAVWDAAAFGFLCSIVIETAFNSRMHSCDEIVLAELHAFRCDAVFPMLCMGFVLGFSWQELWHFHSLLTYKAFLIPSLVLLSIGALLIVGRKRGKIEFTLFALSAFIMGLIGLFSLDESTGIFGATLTLVLFAFHVALVNDLVDFNPVFFLLGISIGLLFGTIFECAEVIVVNLLALFSISYPEVMDASLRAFVYAGTLLALSGYSFVFLNSVPSMREHNTGKLQKGRIVSYLIGRGLSDSQAQILAQIFEGCTAQEIASDLHYSLGLINVARFEGYRMLHVHSAEELRSLIRSEVLWDIDGKVRNAN